jgi:hypothetical protein
MMRSNRAAVILCAAAVICILASASRACAQANKQYLNKELGYSLSYPADHSLKEVGPIVIVTSPVKDKKFQFSPSVNVIVSPLKEKGMKLAEFAALSKKELLGSQPEAVITEEKKDKIAGQEALRITYTLRQNQANFKFLQYVFLYKKKAYGLTYTALADNFEKNFKAAQAIIKSFSLKD